MSISPPSSLYRWPIRILAILIVAVVVYRFSMIEKGNAEAQLPRLKSIPAFSLTERSGKTITNNDLLGKIWVADFIFTTCPGPCPMITASMATIQDATKDDPHIQLVSFTVDPQDDTPAVLSAYANKFGADPNRWWFLTGPEKPLYDLIKDGFWMAVQDNHGQPLEPGENIVTHSTRLALVDASGIVRGFYDGVGEDGRTDLLAAIKTLEKEEKK